MTVPNNAVFPAWNKKAIKAGTHYIHVPNDFADYDEVWAHVLVHGTSGTPTTGNVIMTWQISHPQAGGSYHDVNPIWQDLNYKSNGHLFHSGLDFPAKIVRTVPSTFNPLPDYVRGLRLGTGRARIKINVNLGGGTDPSYIMSLAIYARRTTSDMKPIPQPKMLSANNTLYDYVRDVWGYSIRNLDDGLAKVQFKNGAVGGMVELGEHLQSNASIVRMFERPVRFDSGLFLEMLTGGANGLNVIVYTTDNMDV